MQTIAGERRTGDEGCCMSVQAAGKVAREESGEEDGEGKGDKVGAIDETTAGGLTGRVQIEIAFRSYRNPYHTQSAVVTQ